MKSVFNLGLTFIGLIFLEKMDFEKSPKNGQISAKCKGVNLNFLTILDHFWDFFKRLRKASLGHWKCVFIVIWALLDVYFWRKWTLKKVPKMAKFRPKSKGVNLNFLTILDHFWDFSKRLKKDSLGHWKAFLSWFQLHWTFISPRKWTLKKVPKIAKFRPKSKGVNLNFLTILDHFWDFFKRLRKASLGHWKAFLSLIWALLDVYFSRKWTLKKVPKMAKFRPKRKGVNLNFLTILDHFWDFFKRLRKASLGHWKAFLSWHLNFSGRIFLEKMEFEKWPNGQISAKKMAKFRPKVKGLTLTFWRFWTFFEIF